MTHLLILFLSFCLLTACTAGLNIRQAEDGCSEGDAQACFDLATAYVVGHKVKVNSKTAVRYYQYSAGQGHVLAQRNYASALEFGVGIEKSLYHAYVWYMTAALKGDPVAGMGVKRIGQQFGPELLTQANADALQLP